jgi:hypothetical protein
VQKNNIRPHRREYVPVVASQFFAFISDFAKFWKQAAAQPENSGIHSFHFIIQGKDRLPQLKPGHALWNPVKAGIKKTE